MNAPAATLLFALSSFQATATQAFGPTPGSEADPAGSGRPVATALFAEGVQGVLLDKDTGEPIKGATLALRAPDATPSSLLAGETDARGFFRFRTPGPGTYLLSAQALGYAELKDREVKVTEGRITVLEIRMTPEALQLEPLVVTAEPRNFYLEMEGFYQRKARSGRAIFLTPEAIEIRHPRQVKDLVEGIPGVRETLYRGQRVVYFQGGIRMNGSSVCWPVVWVDRVLVSAGGDLGADPLALNNAVAATDVAALEVYRGVIIPQEFRSTNSACGVVVIWTHRGR